MPKTLEGYIGDEYGQPIEGIAATATRLLDGVPVAFGATQPDGRWAFTDLDEDQEHFVTLLDGAGRAAVRGPWSGELREAWVRDRLNVAGLPVVLDPAAGNTLAWGPDGLYVPPIPPGIDAYTKAESDARYAELTDVDPFPQYLTPAEASATYLTPAAADALFLTQAEGDARYTQGGITQAAADARYLLLTGGTLTGQVTMTRTVGNTLLVATYTGSPIPRWMLDTAGSMQWSDGAAAWDTTLGRNSAGVLAISGKLLTVSPDASNIIEWRANGFYAAAGAVGDIWVNTTGDTMTGDLNMTAHILPTVTNVRDLGSTALRWRKVWATDAEFTNAPTVGGSALLTATAADALFLTPAEGNAAYVNTTGDTMTGDLTVQRDASATEILMLKHASTGAGVRVAAYKSRGTVASPSATLVNDELGKITWYGRGNSADAFAAEIKAEVDAANAPSNVMQGRLLFLTTAVGGGMTERMRIDKDGLVKINPLTDPALPAAYTGQPGLLVQLEGASQLQALALARADTSATATRLNFYRSRGTWASKVALADGDYPMSLEAWGWSGSQWLISSAIRSNVFGVVTTTAMPGSLSFLTADSAGALGARLSIGPSGLVGVGAKADGSAAATLDIKSVANTFTLRVTPHVSTPNSSAFFRVINAADTLVIFGVNNTGWVTDNSGVISSVSGPVRAISVFNAAGTFLGYLPFYSTVT